MNREGEFFIESNYDRSHDPQDYTDRYKNCKILTSKEDNNEIFISTREIPEPFAREDDVYHKLEVHEVGRLDKLSQKYYNTPMLWWVIAQANDIFDPFKEIPIGTLIRIPSRQTLYGNRGMLT